LTCPRNDVPILAKSKKCAIHFFSFRTLFKLYLSHRKFLYPTVFRSDSLRIYICHSLIRDFLALFYRFHEVENRGFARFFVSTLLRSVQVIQYNLFWINYISTIIFYIKQIVFKLIGPCWKVLLRKLIWFLTCSKDKNISYMLTQ